MLDRLNRPKGLRKRRKVVGRGRGSGHGGTSGRGNKGQNSRASGGVRPGYEGGQMPLIRRVPKRGVVLISKPKYEVVSIERLEKFGANADVTPDTLLQAGIIKKKRGRVKILGDGTLKHPLTVRAHAFSKSALQKITSAGGKTEQLGSAKAAKTSESE